MTLLPAVAGSCALLMVEDEVDNESARTVEQ